MQEDTIIQKNLFAINYDPDKKSSSKNIPEDLSAEQLKKESKKRPRQRKSSTHIVNKFKNNLNTESRHDFIDEKSYSYKTVEKQKLTPVLKHYVKLKEENKSRLLLYRLGDFFECFLKMLYLFPIFWK